MNTNKTGSIIDVRTAEEFLEGHLDGAINIPIEQTMQRLQDFRSMPKPIIAYCRSGARSGIVTSLLKQNGISEVINGGSMNAAKNVLA